MRVLHSPAFWAGYRRGVLRAYALAAALLAAWLLAGCAAGQRWDDPDALTTQQRIQYEAGAGLLTLVRAVNAMTGRIDGLAIDGVLTPEEYGQFVKLRLEFRAWFQPVHRLYQAGGDVSGEAGHFYEWQARLVDLYLRLTRTGTPS